MDLRANLKSAFRHSRIAMLRAAPVGKPGSMPRLSSCLVLAPHPDDEVFGLAGLIARKRALGARVRVVYLTDGGGSHHACCGISDSEVAQKRRALAMEAGVIIGLDAKDQVFLGLPDGAIPLRGEKGFEKAVGAVLAAIAEMTGRGRDRDCGLGNSGTREDESWILHHAREDTRSTENTEGNIGIEVFYPHPFEGWKDHVATEEIARAALRAISSKFEVPSSKLEEKAGAGERESPGTPLMYLYRPRLYHYCVWFWFSMPLRRGLRCDWRNARALEMDAEAYDAKQRAIDCYMNALAPCGNPWSGVLPKEFLRAHRWKKELFFQSSVSS